MEDFSERASLNIKALAKAGVKKIVTPCADCYHTLMRLYPQVDPEGTYDIEVLHISQLIAQLLDEGKVSFTGSVELNVTYHDPCHLGRQGEPYVAWDGKEKKILNQVHTWEPRRPRYNGAYGVYDAPRQVIRAIPGVKLTEMERIREYSWCCGAGGACGETDTDFSEFTADERIREAGSTGAQAVVTACPWCETTLEASAKRGGNTIQVMDLLGLIRLSVERSA